MPESRKIFEAEDSDFGDGPCVPRIWERETKDLKRTEADRDSLAPDILKWTKNDSS
jgi:hypothetical protein